MVISTCATSSFENHVSFEGDEALHESDRPRDGFENHVSFEGDEADGDVSNIPR